LRTASEFIQKSLSFELLLIHWEGMGAFPARIPGRSSVALCRRKEQKAQSGAYGLSAFSKYFCLFWSDAGSRDCSHPEADLVDKFLTSLCNIVR